MKLSQLLSACVACATLVLGNGAKHHRARRDHTRQCGSKGIPQLPLASGGSVCLPDSELLPNRQRDVFDKHPAEGIWRTCQNETGCDLPRGHAWTHTTPCFKNPRSDDRFCVFSDATFAEGRGTSFVTTAERANFLASYPAFTHPDTIKGINQDLVRTIPAVYEVKEFPGKGMGLVAKTHIRRGDLIMANTPSLMIDYRSFEELTKEEYLQLQVHAVDYLPAPHRSAVLNLSTHDGAAGLPPTAVVEKIASTNAFDIDPDTDDAEQDNGFYVVFPEIARMNHDCRPNADYRFSYQTLTQYIHATRPINPGEEITLSYINPIMRHEARVKKLKGTWGFQCACDLCTRSRPRVEASDARIRQIKELTKELRSYRTESRANPQMAELLISLYEMEQLWGSMYEVYAYAALEYNGVGDAWTATKYARLAVEYGIPVVGEHDNDVVQMGKLADDPWAHWSWMLRMKKREGWGSKKKPVEEEDEVEVDNDDDDDDDNDEDEDE